MLGRLTMGVARCAINLSLPALAVAGVIVAHQPDPPAPRAAATVNPYDLPGDCRRVTEGFQVLACTAYFEARNQPFLGQVAAVKTVLKRMADPRYPDTIYKVVWQPRQYSWTVDPHIKDTVVRDRRAWRSAVDAAETAVHLTTSHIRLEGGGCDLDTVIRYHERHVHPNWHGVKWACQIGDHVFYADARP